MASLLTKLSRLGSRLGSIAPAPLGHQEEARRDSVTDAPAGRAAVLDDLRARMQEVLARAHRHEARPSPPLDAPELPFVTRQTALGELHERRLHLSPAHRMGRVPIHPARHARADILGLLALDPALAACDPTRALYLDTETTGLAGGAGTVAFLVGLASWQTNDPEPPCLVVEQLLVRNLGEEAPMLERVASRIREASMLVTFNGKAFDLPLLRARFVMARMQAPAEPPHLDLVHVARRLHKPRGIACKLTTLERTLLGFERIDDVPGGEVSACYLHFLRTGDVRALLGVIDHNAWDVIAMAALLGLYGEPLEESSLGADDLAGVARTFKRAGAIDKAQEVIERALSGSPGNLAEGAGPSARALLVSAEIAKARGDRARALLDFEALAKQIDAADAQHLEVRLELAKLYEHFVKDLERAREIVLAGTAEDAARSERRARRLQAKIDKRITKRNQSELFARSRRRAS